VGKGHLAHGIRIQADRRLQREFVAARIGQIESTRVRVEALRDELDDVSEGLIETVRSRDDLGNIGQ
jgi:hypothetical protein